MVAVVLVSAAAVGLALSSSNGDDSSRGTASSPSGGAEGSSDASETAQTSAGRVRTYVRGELAVGLTFDSKDRLLFAEKDKGRIIRVSSSGRSSVLARLYVVGGGEDGLLGLTVDSRDRVFASYTGSSSSCPNPTRKPTGGSLEGHCIWRLKLADRGRKLVADKKIFSAGHPSNASNHVGGGVHIGPDKVLYYGLGDLGENGDPDNGPGRAQSLSVPFGKILRLNPAATNRAATGNPSTCGNVANDSGRAIEDRRIWACGLRNTYEFAFGPDGRLWGSEAGDSCDEINLLKAGVNYGWEPPRTDCAGQGNGAPIKKLSGTPAGIGVWRGAVYFCANSGGAELRRMNMKSRAITVVDAGRGKCALDLEPGPGGLYFSDYSAVYRLTR